MFSAIGELRLSLKVGYSMQFHAFHKIQRNGIAVFLLHCGRCVFIVSRFVIFSVFVKNILPPYISVHRQAIPVFIPVPLCLWQEVCIVASV